MTIETPGNRIATAHAKDHASKNIWRSQISLEIKRKQKDINLGGEKKIWEEFREGLE